MKKTLFFPFILVFIISCSNQQEKNKNPLPNIIYILADDLGYGDLSCYGQENYNTPNIDKLAADGIKFTQHYAGSTVCSPSRNSLMTGFHMGHAIIRGNGRNPNGTGDIPLPASRIAFAEYLQKAGYKTGAFGKWGLGDCKTEGSPLKHGFDEFFGYTDQILAHNSYPEYLLKNNEKVYLKNEVKYLDSTAWHKGLGSVSTKQVEYSNDLIFDEALKFIEKYKTEPFFLYFPTTIPHMNDEAEKGKRFEVPKIDDFDNKHWSEDEKHYAMLIAKLDNYVGKIEKTLDSLNISDNTLIIFTSDNGAVYSIDNLKSNGGLRGYKRDLYEGGIRVPFIAKWNGVIKQNTVSDHISAFWDNFPTILDIARVEDYNITDGISFLPTLIEKGEQKEHEYLYWEFHWWKPSRQAIRMGKWKAIKNSPAARIELYNLDKDISETNNLVEDYPEIENKINKLFKTARKDDN